MAVLQKHPLQKILVSFGLGLILCLAFIIWGYQSRNESHRQWDALQRRLEFSQSGAIAPNAEVLDSLSQANAWLKETNARLDAQLFRIDPESIRNFPGDSTAAYFELAGFVETRVRDFANLGIRLNEGERFGFSQFEKQGPDAGILQAVMAQKEAGELILDLLAEARPVSLHAFKRESVREAPVETSVLLQATGANASRRNSSEEFAEPGEKAEGFESYSFELSFEGYTDSLRRFMKGLNTAGITILARGLRVEPLDRYEAKDEESPSSASVNPFDVLAETQETEDGPIPIIRDNLSLFHLKLEVFLGKRRPTDS